jgi:Spy/CpxP family protein refolding chaperone
LYVHHLIEIEEISMRSRLAFSVLVAASLCAATTLASAQTEPAAGAPATSNAMASMHHHHHHHHAMGYSRREMDKSRPGGLPVSRKAAD